MPLSNGSIKLCNSRENPCPCDGKQPNLKLNIPAFGGGLKRGVNNFFSFFVYIFINNFRKMVLFHESYRNRVINM